MACNSVLPRFSCLLHCSQTTCCGGIRERRPGSAPWQGLPDWNPCKRTVLPGLDANSAHCAQQAHHQDPHHTPCMISHPGSSCPSQSAQHSPLSPHAPQFDAHVLCVDLDQEDQQSRIGQVQAQWPRTNQLLVCTTAHDRIVAGPGPKCIPAP